LRDAKGARRKDDSFLRAPFALELLLLQRLALGLPAAAELLAALAPLLSALLALLLRLLKLRALLGREQVEHLLVVILGRLPQLLAELARAGPLLVRQLAALTAGLRELAQLRALRLGALPQALSERAELLPLRVGQVKLPEGAQAPAVTAPPVALPASAPAAFVPARALVLRRGLLRLLRLRADGERGQEAERGRTLQKLLHVNTPSG
jgi:hypothetical protein